MKMRLIAFLSTFKKDLFKYSFMFLIFSLCDHPLLTAMWYAQDEWVAVYHRKYLLKRNCYRPLLHQKQHNIKDFQMIWFDLMENAQPDSLMLGSFID